MAVRVQGWRISLAGVLCACAVACVPRSRPVLDEELATPAVPADFPDSHLVDAMCSFIGYPSEKVIGAIYRGALPAVRLGALLGTRGGGPTGLWTYATEAPGHAPGRLRIATRFALVDGLFLEFERTWFWTVHARLEAITRARFGATDTSGPLYRIRDLTYAEHRISIFEPRNPIHVAAFGCQIARPLAPVAAEPIDA